MDSSVDDTLERLQSGLQRISLGEPGAAEAEENAGEETGDPSGDGSDGLARLVLTLVQLLHDVLERQAVRRMDEETLTPDEVERIGQALMRQAQEIERICHAFGIDPDDLDIDLDVTGR